jgi:hypothetical protein
MDEHDLLIDAALDSLPLVPTPPGFTARVMAGVWRPVVTFKLDFMDFALPAFFALFASFFLAAGLFAILSIDQLATMKLELQGRLLLAQVLLLTAHLEFILIPLLALCGGAFLLVIVAAGVWVIQSPLRVEGRN